MSRPIIERVKALGLSPDHFIVAGSGVLDALDIRSAGDVDLVVTEDLYEALRAQNSQWKEEKQHDRYLLVREGKLEEVWYNWPSGKGLLSYDEMKNSSIMIDEVRFMSLEFVYDWKLWMNRPKDQRDVRLIENYRKKNP